MKSAICAGLNKTTVAGLPHKLKNLNYPKKYIFILKNLKFLEKVLNIINVWKKYPMINVMPDAKSVAQ